MSVADQGGFVVLRPAHDGGVVEPEQFAIAVLGVFLDEGADVLDELGLFVLLEGAEGGGVGDGSVTFTSVVAPVPEPSAWAALGLGGLVLRARRRGVVDVAT